MSRLIIFFLIIALSNGFFSTQGTASQEVTPLTQKQKTDLNTMLNNKMKPFIQKIDKEMGPYLKKMERGLKSKKISLTQDQITNKLNELSQRGHDQQYLNKMKESLRRKTVSLTPEQIKMKLDESKESKIKNEWQYFIATIANILFIDLSRNYFSNRSDKQKAYVVQYITDIVTLSLNTHISRHLPADRSANLSSEIGGQFSTALKKETNIQNVTLSTGEAYPEMKDKQAKALNNFANQSVQSQMAPRKTPPPPAPRGNSGQHPSAVQANAQKNKPLPPPPKRNLQNPPPIPPR